MSEFIATIMITATIGLLFGFLAYFFTRFILKVKDQKKLRSIGALCFILAMSLLSMTPLKTHLSDILLLR